MAKNEKNVKEKKQKNSSYFKEMKAELKKVVWPTPKELFDNTVAVIVFVLIIAVIVFVLDLCFDNLNKYGITKLQESVQSAFNSDEDSASDTDTSDENSEDSNNVDGESSNETSEETQTTEETTSSDDSEASQSAE